MTKKLPEWDLTDFYQDIKDPQITKDIKEVSNQARRFESLFKGKLADAESEIIGSAIEEYEEIEQMLGKLSSFAYLVYAQKVTSDERAAFYQDISEKVNEISLHLLFFPLELNKIEDAHLNEKIAQSEKLNHYQPWLRDIRVYKPYQLSDEAEKILHEKSITASQSWSRLFDETLAGLKFEFDGKKINCQEAFDKLSSHKALERKKAAKSIGKTLGENSKIFTLITNVLAKDKEINDRLRGLPSPVTSRNLNNLIEDEVVDALTTTVKENYKKLSHRYYKIKAKWLKKDKLSYWDRNAPLPGEVDKKIPWQEAVDIVYNAYNDFSPELARIGKQFFDKNWIDAPAKDGKESGAFSHPTVPSVHPYILLNYQGKLRDVMTLAHELGHGVHQCLSAEQGALMADTPLTLAETASVFGEQLTFRALLKNEKDEKLKKNMIANKVEDMLNTVVRQIAFFEFEKNVHERRKDGELAAEEINKIWLDVQKESLGPAIKFEDEYKYYWSYIPHFIHSPFYVYSYAFGDCLVNSLYKVYENEPDGFEEKYLNMLRAGGTLRHKELLSPFGLDATKPDFWQHGLNMISEFIDQL